MAQTIAQCVVFGLAGIGFYKLTERLEAVTAARLELARLRAQHPKTGTATRPRT